MRRAPHIADDEVPQYGVHKNLEDPKMHRVEFVREKVLRAQVNAGGKLAANSSNLRELQHVGDDSTRRFLAILRAGMSVVVICPPTRARVHVAQELLQLVGCCDMHVAFACSASHGEENVEMTSVSRHVPSGPPLASQRKQGFENPNVTANSAQSPLAMIMAPTNLDPAKTHCRSIVRQGSMVCRCRG